MSPRFLSSIFRRLFCGPLGADACHELDQEYSKIRAQNGAAIAWFWYFGHLFAPGTWALAVQLRRRGRGPAGDPRLPGLSPLGRGGGSRRGFTFGFSWLDLKLGLRISLKHVGLTSVAVVALSIGIPVGLLPTHVMDALHADLPFFEGERIVALRFWDPSSSRTVNPGFLELVRWNEEATQFDQLGVARTRQFLLASGDGRGLRIVGAEVTASMFDMVQVPPALGRPLVAADERVGAPDVVVLGYDVWQSYLGGDTEAVGKVIRLGITPHIIVGIMPQGFLFPLREQFWVPIRTDNLALRSGDSSLFTFGRLAGGTSIETAQVELSRVSARLADAGDSSETLVQLRAEIVDFWEYFVPSNPAAVWTMRVVQLLTFLLLIMACGSVGILILARSATRLEEFAVRSALGASRSRVLGQLFAETLLFALLSTGLGLLLLDWVAARWATPGLAAVGLPFWVDLGVTPKTAMTALFLGVFCAVVAGILPALKATRGDIRGTMRGAVAEGAGIRFGGGSGALVVAMVTLTASCLLIGGAVSPSFLQIKGGVKGFDASHYLSAELEFPWAWPYTSEEQTQAIRVKQALIDRLESEPEVLGVGFGSQLPGTNQTTRRIEVEGGEIRDEPVGQMVFSTYVDLGYFKGLGYTVVSGRDFDSGDVADDRSAVIVNTAFVERNMGGRSPVGRRFRFVQPTDRQSEASPWYEIVGVVGHPDSDSEGGGVYHPIAASQLAGFRFAIHLGPDPTSFVPRLREILMDIEPSAMILDPIALNEVFSDEDFLYQAGALGLVFMVVLSGFLGIAGVYALLSLSVARRTREIGVRRAVGATSASIGFTIAKRALLQLGVGVSIGSLLGGVILSEMTKDPGIDFASWPMLLGLFGVGVVVIGLLSCAVPTVRGLRISPMDALRVDG